jgi:hypothetical protein
MNLISGTHNFYGTHNVRILNNYLNLAFEDSIVKGGEI